MSTVTAENTCVKSDILNFAKVVLFFANNSTTQLYKTKLNKLLFYSQFLHYKRFKKTLFDGKFIRDFFGPVVEGLDLKLEFLKAHGAIETMSTEYGTVIRPKVMLKETAYSTDELIILKSVLNKFDRYTARQISDYSHEERLWRNTSMKGEISLERANDLNDF